MSKPEDRHDARLPIWLVGKVQAGMEFDTAGRLRRQGVRVKCPGYVAIIRPASLPARAGNLERRAKPAYPGYVFLDRNSVVDLERICLKTEGFMCIVSIDNDYSACDDQALRQAMEYVRKLRKENYFGGASRRAIRKFVQIGAYVKVHGGPMGGRYGIVKAVSGVRAKLKDGDFDKATWIPIAQLVLQR